MKPEHKELLINAGVNYNACLQRFMYNETLCDRFLAKFTQDDSYAALCYALDFGNCDEAFRAAHTLKGVAGNLSLDILFQAVSAQAEHLRAGDLEAARAMLPCVKAAYAAVIDALSFK